MAANVDSAGSISITAEPIDPRRCRFVVDRPVYPQRWAFFEAPDQARGAPLAERLFAIEGVTAVLIAHNKVIVTRPQPQGVPVVGAAIRAIRALMGDRTVGSESWPALGRRIGSAIRDHLASADPAVADPCPVLVPTEAEIRARVQRVLDEQVNPVIASHGGGAAILNVKDNVVYVEMTGGCQGCGLAEMTLKHGVEAAIRDAVPEVGEIIDLTDHASGRNPYHRK